MLPTIISRVRSNKDHFFHLEAVSPHVPPPQMSCSKWTPRNRTRRYSRPHQLCLSGKVNLCFWKMRQLLSWNISPGISWGGGNNAAAGGGAGTSARQEYTGKRLVQLTARLSLQEAIGTLLRGESTFPITQAANTDQGNMVTTSSLQLQHL